MELTLFASAGAWGLLIYDSFNLLSNSLSADNNISIWSSRFGLFCNKSHHVTSKKPFCLKLITAQEGPHNVSATMVSILLFSKEYAEHNSQVSPLLSVHTKIIFFCVLFLVSWYFQ